MSIFGPTCRNTKDNSKKGLETVMEYGFQITPLNILIDMKDNTRMTVKTALESISGKMGRFTKASF